VGRRFETIRAVGGNYAEVDVLGLDSYETYYLNVLVKDEENNIKVYQAVEGNTGG